MRLAAALLGLLAGAAGSVLSVDLAGAQEPSARPATETSASGARTEAGASTPEVAEGPGMGLSVQVAGQRFTKRVRSFKEMREEGVVIQKLDYSCGAAAMATLMKSFFGQSVTEEEVVGFIFIHGQTPEEGLKKYFRRKGFSLLDLKRFVEFRGFKAAGYKEMTIEDLIEVLRDQQVPLLVSISPFGYNHFVVVRGIQGDRIHLADPALGKTTMPIRKFIDVWVDGIGFVVTQPTTPALPRLGARGVHGDEALDRITAAGAPDGTSRPSTAGSATRAATGSAFLGTDTPHIEIAKMQSVIYRQSPQVNANALPTFVDPLNNGLMTIVSFQNFRPIIQLGRPEGYFIDFSPPPGQNLQVR